MDTNQQDTLARIQDPALAARIVGSIVELERDYRLAERELSDRFMQELTATMTKAAPEPWEIAKTEWSTLMRHPDWKPTKKLGHGDAWLEISEISEEDHTWISAAVGAGGATQLGLELKFRAGLVSVADVVLQETANASLLKKLGFQRDSEGQRLHIPIVIDRMKLSKGYGENDLATALAPVTQITSSIVSAAAELNKMIAVIQKSKPN